MWHSYWTLIVHTSGRIGVRRVLVGMVVLGLVLSGIVERSASVALLSLSDPLSSLDFAEYVTNTSYVTQYCTSFNDTNDVDMGTDTDSAGSEIDVTDFDNEEDDSFVQNRTTHTGHGRRIVAEPPLKVGLTRQSDVEVTQALVMEVLQSNLSLSTIITDTRFIST